jgi:hypothetical protein
MVLALLSAVASFSPASFSPAVVRTDGALRRPAISPPAAMSRAGLIVAKDKPKKKEKNAKEEEEPKGEKGDSAPAAPTQVPQAPPPDGFEWGQTY